LPALQQLPLRIARYISNLHSRDRALFPVTALIGVVLALLQWTSGAWTAEFDGYPDESAQFVTGRMVWEYLRALPSGSPIAWANQYYIHYPKVAMGHWPPGYHLAEALWSLPFGSSRMSAMWLQWFLGLAALTSLYVLVRTRLPLAVTCGILFFALATPVFQQGLEQTMSELACMLCSILFMHGVLRLLESPDRFAINLVVFSFAALAFTKGTAVCLLPVPVLAVLAGGRSFPWHALRRRIALAACVLAACVLWFALTTNALYWGGMTTSMQWPIPSLVKLTGWGFLALALFGCKREPLPVVAASMIASAIAISSIVRAMNEPRHWIIVLPPILLLSGYGLMRVRPMIRPLLAFPALVLFPWLWYHQVPTGYRQLLKQIHLPARMLVSSGRISGEGAWIAEVAIAERYPASLVARSSKVLAEMGWNGENYRLLVHSGDDVKRRLDELAVEVVIVDAPLLFARPDQVLLKDMLENSPGWRICCGTKSLLAYYRVSPPAFPRKPLVLDAGPWHLEERIPASP